MPHSLRNKKYSMLFQEKTTSPLSVMVSEAGTTLSLRRESDGKSNHPEDVSLCYTVTESSTDPVMLALAVTGLCALIVNRKVNALEFSVNSHEISKGAIPRIAEYVPVLDDSPNHNHGHASSVITFITNPAFVCLESILSRDFMQSVKNEFDIFKIRILGNVIEKSNAETLFRNPRCYFAFIFADNRNRDSGTGNNVSLFETVKVNDGWAKRPIDGRNNSRTLDLSQSLSSKVSRIGAFLSSQGAYGGLFNQSVGLLIRMLHLSYLPKHSVIAISGGNDLFPSIVDLFLHDFDLRPDFAEHFSSYDHIDSSNYSEKNSGSSLGDSVGSKAVHCCFFIGLIVLLIRCSAVSAIGTLQFLKRRFVSGVTRFVVSFIVGVGVIILSLSAWN